SSLNVFYAINPSPCGLVSPRRFVWNFFRVENEYVNDCLQFHSVLVQAGVISSEGAAPGINKETYAMLRAEHNRKQPPTTQPP
ncbi:hypothetical protein SARC_11375, partial [Sphaeroforma arctica JP610]